MKSIGELKDSISLRGKTKVDVNVANENIAQDISSIYTKKYKEILTERKTYKVIKRIIDVIGAIVGSLILIPLILGIAIAKIILKDKGPMIYTQNRIGKNGKIFKMYKFRSMVVGADEALKKYLEENAEAREEYRINKKLKDDPRVTKIGKFIRKTSIDEFPQFINVLKGDMSLVGPRPYLEREIPDIGNYYPYIVAAKPGITGLWQVSGRNDVTFNARLELDKEYYEKRNTMLDLKILIKTALKVFDREGAI